VSNRMVSLENDKRWLGSFVNESLSEQAVSSTATVAIKKKSRFIIQ